MELKDVKNITFPKPSYEEWKEAVEASLKGKSVEKLKTNTYEGITLYPLYTENTDSKNNAAELPGFFPFTRGTSPAGYYEKPWLVVQPVSGITAEEANDKMRASFKRGQNVVAYPARLLAEGARVEKLLKDIPLKEIPIFIDLKGKQKDLFPQFKAVAESQNVQLTGVAAEDPIAEWLICGQLPEDTDQYFAEWLKTIQDYQKVGPDLKTILINTSVYHNGGANAVQEIAYGLSAAVQYVLEGQKQGLSITEVSERIVFSFAVDSNYFMSIAKLRAARRLWAGLSEAFDTAPDYFKMAIHAVTSELTETLYDKHVNILRTTNQAFAAAIGGIQYLQIHPFNHASGESDDFSERIARSTHLVLKEETNITSVVDPAGGSWYVEQLTDELAEKAWAKFLEIDEAGGIIELVKQGILQKEIAEVYQGRVLNAAFRKESIIGTNVYPNPSDKIKISPQDNDLSYMKVVKPVDITPIILDRVSVQFEQLRLRSETYKESNGTAPTFGMINLKDLKSYKPRADFVKGLGAAGGIETVGSKGCQSITEAVDFVAATNLPIYCVCGSDEDYSELAANIMKEIKKKFPSINIYIAGKQQEELEMTLSEAGVKDFIHVKTNAIAILRELLHELGVN
ncbi:putative methylmalonyl-CoA mutase small subunit [Peribacillus sp. Bi96]|uniref:methylmalonyl-CoA mutase family protein n=1 Tax=unclassified Peribacillus TaxID=2675266 RepID=UPI001D9D98E6|nr:methylmalonyl-CoA mutase family protein [Peribacillus sp. Bi96]CAH0178881.1 putative methylmalonyl-CoA mutase small subunit [Peribacillus sp. Bi96]